MLLHIQQQDITLPLFFLTDICVLRVNCCLIKAIIFKWQPRDDKLSSIAVSVSSQQEFILIFHHVLLCTISVPFQINHHSKQFSLTIHIFIIYFTSKANTNDITIVIVQMFQILFCICVFFEEFQKQIKEYKNAFPNIIV